MQPGETPTLVSGRRAHCTSGRLCGIASLLVFHILSGTPSAFSGCQQALDLLVLVKPDAQKLTTRGHAP